MHIVSHYKNNNKLRKSFFKLANSIFGIEFDDWYKAGYWNNNYKCYSFIDNDTVISNASASYMDIILNGHLQKIIQIGTVMTHPSYRGKGLAGKLIKHICNNSKAIVLLFAENKNRSFYEHLGFTIRKQYLYTHIRECLPKRSISIEHWDMKQKQYRELLIRHYKNKEAFNGFDVLNGEHILFFHLLYDRNLQVGYYREINAILIYKINKDNLNIYEIISPDMPAFPDIIKCVPADSINTVKLMFTPPDIWMKFLSIDILNDKDNLLFVSNEHMFSKKIHISPIYIA